MSGELPNDRLPVRERALPQVTVGLFALVAGVLVVTRTFVSLDSGWTGAIPRPLQSMIGSLSALLGLYLTVVGLLWMFVPLRTPRPVIHFESNHVAIRGPMFPTTFVVHRDNVREIHKWTARSTMGRLFGSPMVVIQTVRGRGRGVPHVYAEDPDSLVADLATWASAPIGLTRRGQSWDVSSDDEDERLQGLRSKPANPPERS